MSQQKKACLMAISVLMLISLAFCLEMLPEGKSVQVGRLIIGSSRTTNDSKDGILKKLYDERVGDIKDYQSDQLQLAEGFPLVWLKLQRLRPSVQCNNDSMSLHIQGSRIPSFMVETSEEGLVPLSQMPSHCGFSMKRVRRDLSLVANYGGCNVAQQGNTYILPLRVLGVAVKIVCPVAHPISTVSCSPTAMIVNLGMSTDAVRLKVYGVWQPLYQASTTCGFTVNVVQGGLTLTAPYTSNCWQYEGSEMYLSVQYTNGELTVSCPVVQLPAAIQPGNAIAAPAGSGQQVYPWFPETPYPYGMPWQFHNQYPPVFGPTVAPTTIVPPASGGLKPYPWFPRTNYPYGKPWQFNNQYPPVLGPTTAPAITVPPASGGLKPYPWFPRTTYPYGGIAMAYNQYPPVFGQTTTVPPASGGLKLYPWLPRTNYPYAMPWQFHNQYPPVFGPTPATTVPPASGGLKQYPLFPRTYYPYGYGMSWQWRW